MVLSFPLSCLWEPPLSVPCCVFWRMLTSLAGPCDPAFRQALSPPLHSHSRSHSPGISCVFTFLCLCTWCCLCWGSLSVLQDQGQVSSLRTILELPQPSTSTQDFFMLHFALAFTMAVNCSVMRGHIYVAVFHTEKVGTHLLCRVSTQHGASFLVLSRRPTDCGWWNIREEGP